MMKEQEHADPPVYHRGQNESIRRKANMMSNRVPVIPGFPLEETSTICEFHRIRPALLRPLMSEGNRRYPKALEVSIIFYIRKEGPEESKAENMEEVKKIVAEWTQKKPAELDENR